MTFIEKILDELGADIGDTLIVQKGKTESVYNLLICEGYTSNETILSLRKSKAGDTWENAINDLLSMEPDKIKVKRYIAPCPFCGSDDIRIARDSSGCYCHCINCHADGPCISSLLVKVGGKSEKMAIDLWNKAKK